MTRLDCTVTSCLYNKERCCCKDNIEVTGDHARHSRDTCCISFRECTFNENCHCQAKHISVAGGAACDCRETECATFRCKCE